MEEKKLFKLENFQIQIPQKRILHRLGYSAGTDKINDSVKVLIEEAKKNMAAIIRPAAVYTILAYNETNKHPVFAEADKIAFCICTIGDDLEKASAELIKNNEMLKGFILDSLGSEAAEEVAQESDKIIAAQARSMGFWPSKRFSPGYGIWDIREQSYLFSLLPAADIGIRLSESFMMIPRKSVSFRINFYKDKTLSTRPLKGL